MTPSLKRLQDLRHEKDCEGSAMVRTHGKEFVPRHPYKDTDANSLTKCIVDWINLNGGQAERVNTMGVYDAKRGKYRPGTGKRGSSDVHSTIPVQIVDKTVGLSCKFEVKAGKDRLSTHQSDYIAEVKSAGGFAFVVHNFDEFMECYNRIINYYKK